MIGSCFDNSQWFGLVTTRNMRHSGQIHWIVPLYDMDGIWIKFYQYELYDEFKPGILPRVGIISMIEIESGLISFGCVLDEFSSVTP